MPSRISTHKPGNASLVPARPRNSEQDRESKRFYNSQAWIRARRMHLLDSPLCVKCREEGLLTPATHVHHVIEVLADASQRLEDANLESLCTSHHSIIHASEPKTPQAT